MYIGVNYVRVFMNHMVTFICTIILDEEDTIPLLNTPCRCHMVWRDNLYEYVLDNCGIVLFIALHNFF